ncbi:WEB family protein At2g40480-like [Malania oleifera]|uniref:WEB family protein At2g40480-like n=1 Tax=Malania oleifera TaxID=397392 RepID=UPI0025ADF1FC|nr:WEB family protein At2g40480-like [Malania oleifera]
MAETMAYSATQPIPGTPEVSETTKKINSRVEIDTSPPFASVKEAVTHFEGRAFWIPIHMLQQPRNAYAVFDISKVEEQAAELEKDLTVKEQETLNVLKELETAKRIVEELKLKLQKEVSACISTPDSMSNDNISMPSVAQMNLKSPENVPNSPQGLILMELKQAKQNLSKTTNDLASIRASVESLNTKMIKEKISLESNHGRLTSSLEEGLNQRRLKFEMANAAEKQGGSNNLNGIAGELQQLNFAAEQFIKMAEAAKCEVLRAMSEVEHTKTSMKTAEMRWVAAKKMEEAARAVEAVALAEMKCLSNYSEGSCSSGMSDHQNPDDGITLSLEEYSSLTRKARKAEELMLKRKAVDTMLQNINDEANTSKLAMLKNLGKATQDVEFSKMALEEALNRVEVANAAKLHAKETHQRARLVPNSTRFNGDSHLLFDGNRSNLLDYESKPVLRPSISVRDILGRKQMLSSDEFLMRKQREDSTDHQRQKVSLSQMLHLQRSVLSAPNVEDQQNHGIGDQKQFLAQRKKFGFIHISLPLTKQSKKKMQASNHRR